MSEFEERVRALFAGPEVRRVYRDGIEHVEVSAAALREAFGDDGPSKDEEMVAHLLAIFGSALPQHIGGITRRQRVAAEQGDTDEVARLQRQLDLMRAAESLRLQELKQL